MMTSSQIRQSFLDFFKSKEHSIVPSDSLMPSSPNLLFTNSGMNQFVPYFLAERTAPHTRIADTQKCIRAGGKHNDLEDVGFDTYHHTFFEMLGNWSFGDYFKTESIQWGWELLTKEWGFPKNRLYATVYKPKEGEPATFDEEAYKIWEDIFKKEGMDPSVHIRLCGKKDNFWMMGDTGPCGPCSEIHVDLTPGADTQGKLVNSDSPYCIEIWNHVFIQFNAQPDGTFIPLAQKHVDTGMGLERVAGIIANTKNFTDFSSPPSNYESDLFQDIFKCISTQSGIQYRSTIPTQRKHLTPIELQDCIFRVLADHIRTLSFSIADGILPGNEGRNYVLRRILRRAVMFSKRLNLPSGFFTSLCIPLIDKMGQFFPELEEKKAIIQKVLSSEEQSFERTLDRGLALLEKITQSGAKVISGQALFELYDTYGFPIDLSTLIAEEKNLTVDLDGFNEQMEKQRSRARASQKKSTITVSQEGLDTPPTRFVGYSINNQDYTATILACTQDQEQTCIIVDQTPFYAEMGGQIGDSGLITINEESFLIENTVKKNDQFIHIIKDTAFSSSILNANQNVYLSVDTKRRKSIERNHTATHLLHWALRKTVGTHVQQAGSFVGPDYLRFDFSCLEALTPEQIIKIENLVNHAILENATVKCYEVPFDEKPSDCLALFGEKYGKTVRVVDIGGYSLELCGGTHVGYTGQVGCIKITSESAIASGVRRIEAISGSHAIEYMQHNAILIDSICQDLSCKSSDIKQRLHHFFNEKNQLERQLRSFQQKEIAFLAKNLSESSYTKNNLQYVISTVPSLPSEDLRSLATQTLKHIISGVVLLASINENKATLIALCSPEAIQQGYQAGKIIQELSHLLGGKGGGKPDLAMGAGKDVHKVHAILNDFKEKNS